MIKYFFIGLVLVFANILCMFAQTTPLTQTEEQQKMQTLMQLLSQDGLKGNEDFVRTQSKDLSYQSKLVLYTTYRENPTTPFLLNFFISLGIGSFVQHDTTSGFIILGGEVAGCALAAAEPYAGGIVVGAAVIYGWVAPFIYSKKSNDRLKNSLQIASSSDMRLQPYVASGSADSDIDIGLTLSF
mgnify:CR=1 FL=1